MFSPLDFGWVCDDGERDITWLLRLDHTISFLLVFLEHILLNLGTSSCNKHQATQRQIYKKINKSSVELAASSTQTASHVGEPLRKWILRPLVQLLQFTIRGTEISLPHWTLPKQRFMSKWIIGCFKPLSFAMICYIAIDHQNNACHKVHTQWSRDMQNTY